MEDRLHVPATALQRNKPKNFLLWSWHSRKRGLFRAMKPNLCNLENIVEMSECFLERTIENYSWPPQLARR